MSHNQGSRSQPPLAAEALEPRTLFTSPPPTVVDAFVGGSHWTQPFKDYLADNVQGASAEHGVSLNHTYAQGILPWVNLDRITLSFNAVVAVDQADLTVRGVTVSQYPVVEFEYSSDPLVGSTATWTLGRPLASDRLLMRLDVDGPNGVRFGFFGTGRIDGDGDYQQGGDFVRRLDMLPGNLGGGPGPLTFRSVAYIRGMMGTTTADVGSGRYAYAEWGDLDGSGRINVIDLAHVRYRVGDQLPPSQPSAAASPVDTAPSLFGTTPIRIKPAGRGLLAVN